jgi:hypothetical protein
MKTLDKATVIALRAEIESALAAVATKHGIAIKAGNGNYSGTNATLKLEISVVDASGTTITKEAAAFKQLAILYGFTPEHLGRTFTIRGKSFNLAGIDRKSYKYPVLATNGGKTFKLRLEDVQSAFGVKSTRDFGVSIPGFSH